MLLYDVAVTSAAVAATGSRLAKRAELATLLTRAASDRDDLEIAVAFLSGELRQRRTGIGWAKVGLLPDPASEPALTLTEVDAALEEASRLAGAGSTAQRAGIVARLFSRATAAEQRLLRGLLIGDVRQGALDAAVLDAIATASGVPLVLVRRAAMLRGAGGPVAVAALMVGHDAVASFALTVGRPVRPMLAASAPDVAAALTTCGLSACLDTKLDGIRVQVHQWGEEVRIFTRSLDDITARLPQVRAAARSFGRSSLILDGEVLLLDPTGRPRPFQETAARTASATGTGAGAADPVAYYFDVLHVDGTDLIDAPLSDRLRWLDAIVPEKQRVPRLRTDDPLMAQRFFDDAVAGGQEGVVVKSLTAPYDAGRRGSAWVKVKPRHTLDLVVLAVEWGSGRRQGWLSNIHVGARDATSGGFVMLGKTFKGMTDETLAWQTERFLSLEVSRSGAVVRVRPEQVVEIAFDGLQRSSRYPGGLALRFARVLRYRDDKPPAEADTIQSVRSLAGVSPT